MTTVNRNRIETVDQEGISASELLRKVNEWFVYLVGKWKPILIFSVLGGSFGYLYAYSSKPVYTASTNFVLETGENGGGLGQYAGLASMVGLDIGGSGGGIFQGDNLIELYKSRTMLEKTLLSPIQYRGEKKLLIDLYIEMNGLRKVWELKPELKAVEFTEFSEFKKGIPSRVKDSLLGAVTVDIRKNYLIIGKPDKKLNIIRVDVKSINELFAKAFNEKIVENVNDFYLQTKTKKSSENVLILQQKVDSVRAEMNGAIYRGVLAADATPNLNPTRQVQRMVPVQRSQFSAEANKEVLSELLKNLELSKMSLLKETPLIQVIDVPILPLEKEGTGKLRSLILGGFLSGFLAVAFFLCRKFFKDLDL